MKTIKILFFFLMINTALFAQSSSQDFSPYYKLCNEAFTSKANGNYEEAILKYEEAFQIFFSFVEDLEELKDCYKKIGNSQKMLEIWERMVLSGFTLHYKSYLVCPKATRLSFWESKIPDDEVELFAVVNYDSLVQVRSSYIDQEKSKYVEAIIIGEKFCEYSRFFYPRKMHDAFWEINAKLFMNLEKSPYMPNRKESNLWSDETGLIIALIHISQTIKGDDLMHFLAVLKEHVKKGNLHPMQYASIYDANVAKQKKEEAYYGVQFIMEDNGKIAIRYPKDIDLVNKRRAEDDLPSLEIYAKAKGYTFKKQK